MELRGGVVDAPAAMSLLLTMASVVLLVQMPVTWRGKAGGTRRDPI